MAIWKDTFLSDENVLKHCLYDKVIPSREITPIVNINGQPNKYKTFTQQASLVDTAINMSTFNHPPEEILVQLLNNQQVVPKPQTTGLSDLEISANMIQDTSSYIVDEMFSNVIKNAPDKRPVNLSPRGKTKGFKDKTMRNALKSITGAKSADMRSIKKALRDKFRLSNDEITDYLNSLMAGDLQDLPVSIQEIENSLMGSNSADPLDPQDDPEDAP